MPPFYKTFPELKYLNTRRRKANPAVDLPIDSIIPNFDDEEGIFFTYGVKTFDDPLPALKEHFGDSIEVVESAIYSLNSNADPYCRALFSTPHWIEGFTSDDLQDSITIGNPTHYISVRLVKDTPESRQLFEAKFKS